MTIIIDGTSGITFPAGGVGNTTSAVVGVNDSQTLANKAIGAGFGGSTLTLGTTQASTSGTNIDFTGIPAWAKRITVMFNGVSTNGTSNLLVQIGSGAIDSTGYVSGATQINTTSANIASSSIGLIATGTFSAASTIQGSFLISSLGNNSWVSHSVVWNTVLVNYLSAGTKTLSGTLDRVRITTVNGTDVFDAGSINIMWE